jgi:hypothetical protein
MLFPILKSTCNKSLLFVFWIAKADFIFYWYHFEMGTLTYLLKIVISRFSWPNETILITTLLKMSPVCFGEKCCVIIKIQC